MVFILGKKKSYFPYIKGTCKKFSVLDILVIEDIDTWPIENDFYDSNLPIKIDIVKKSNISESFYDNIKGDLVKI